LAPGSYLAVSHLESAPVLVEALKHYKAAEVFCRGSDEVARFFDDTPLVEPGVVRVSEWRPEKHESDIPQEHPNDSVWVLGGVGRKQ